MSMHDIASSVSAPRHHNREHARPLPRLSRRGSMLLDRTDLLPRHTSIISTSPSPNIPSKPKPKPAPIPPLRTFTNHLGSSGASASFPPLARWTTGWCEIFWMSGRRFGSGCMHWVIRSVRAGLRGERSTTEKSPDRRDWNGAPFSGTQMFVDTSRTTTPKLLFHQLCLTVRIGLNPPEDIGGHDELAPQHLRRHVSPISFSLKLLLPSA